MVSKPQTGLSSQQLTEHFLREPLNTEAAEVVIQRRNRFVVFYLGNRAPVIKTLRRIIT